MKILSNKKYTDLLLKSTRGLFGTITDDDLLRNSAALYEESKQLKEKILIQEAMLNDSVSKGKYIEAINKCDERDSKIQKAIVLINDLHPDMTKEIKYTDLLFIKKTLESSDK